MLVQLVVAVVILLACTCSGRISPLKYSASFLTKVPHRFPPSFFPFLCTILCFYPSFRLLYLNIHTLSPFISSIILSLFFSLLPYLLISALTFPPIYTSTSLGIPVLSPFLKSANNDNDQSSKSKTTAVSHENINSHVEGGSRGLFPDRHDLSMFPPMFVSITIPSLLMRWDLRYFDVVYRHHQLDPQSYSKSLASFPWKESESQKDVYTENSSSAGKGVNGADVGDNNVARGRKGITVDPSGREVEVEVMEQEHRAGRAGTKGLSSGAVDSGGGDDDPTDSSNLTRISTTKASGDLSQSSLASGANGSEKGSRNASGEEIIRELWRRIYSESSHDGGTSGSDRGNAELPPGVSVTGAHSVGLSIDNIL